MNNDREYSTGESPKYDREHTSAEYNAYRDDISVQAAVKAKLPQDISVDGPRPGEPPEWFFARRAHEQNIIRTESRRLLRSSSNRMGLLLLLYLLISTSLQIAVSLITSSIGSDFFYQTDIGGTVFMLIVYVLIYPVAFPIAIYVGDIGEKRTLKSYFRKPDCSPWYVLKSAVLAIGAAYVASIAVNIITSMLTDITGIEIYDPGLSDTFTSAFDAVAYFVALCIFAPLFEELFFRGTMLAHHLKFGGWQAVLATSIMFGLFHQNLQQFVYTAVTGAVFALVVIKTGSLIPSVIMHFSFNLIAYLQMLTGYLIDNYDALMSGESTVAEGSPIAVTLFTFFNYLPYLLILAAVIILIVELLYNKGSFRLPSGDSMLTESENNSCFFSAPAVVAAIAIVGVIIIFYAFVYPILL